MIIVCFPVPASSFFPFAVQKVRPHTFGQIILSDSLFIKNRRCQKTVSEHILHIEIFHCRVIFKFQDHWPHHRNSRFVRLHRHTVDVWHQLQFEFRKFSAHFHRFFVEQPWHPVALGAM